jgi:hypothetical protein
VKSTKLLRATLRLAFVVALTAWLMFAPRSANAQFSNCGDFWNWALSWCDSQQGFICGGDCFEYVNCPLGCSQSEWCCCDSFGCDCCQNEAFGWAYCCW